MSNKFLMSIVAAAPLAFSVGEAQAVNLLSDGGFEAVAVTGVPQSLLGNYGAGVVSSGPWTNEAFTGSGKVMLIQNPYSEVNNSAGPTLAFKAQEGVKAMDLTGAGNQGPITLSQTIGSLAAGPYELRFWLGDINGGDSRYLLDAKVNVLIDDIQQGATRTFATLSSTATWQEFVISFTRSSVGPAKFSFSTVGLTNDNYAGLDNVSVTLVPEPATYAMILAGLAAVGFAARRRKNH